MPQVGHLRLVAAVALGLSAVASAPIPEDAALQDEIAFFQRYDTNTDGFHSKKEFYYAIMEDEFEALASKYNKMAVDMEFEYADLNGDKKISLDEWKGVFFHEQPQEALYVDGELQDVSHEAQEEESAASVPAPPPAAPAPPQSSAAFTGVSASKSADKKMHIGSEVTLQTGRKAYLSEDATWHETNDFCKEAGVRLCTEDELCSRKTGVHIKDDENLTDADRQTRWAPLHGSAHLWLELRNCGLTRWPDDYQHPGIIVCCSDEDATTQQDSAPVSPKESTQQPAPQDLQAGEGAGAATAQEGDAASGDGETPEAPAGFHGDGESPGAGEPSTPRDAGRDVAAGSGEAREAADVPEVADPVQTSEGPPASETQAGGLKEGGDLDLEQAEVLGDSGAGAASGEAGGQVGSESIAVEEVSKKKGKGKKKGKKKGAGKKIKPPKVS